jgi:hypothetical protein
MAWCMAATTAGSVRLPPFRVTVAVQLMKGSTPSRVYT